MEKQFSWDWNFYAACDMRGQQKMSENCSMTNSDTVDTICNHIVCSALFFLLVPTSLVCDNLDIIQATVYIS